MARVLVVEDDRDAASVLEHQLGQAGHEVHTAPNPDRAWEVAVATSPDVAVIDLMLGGASGWTFIERARGDSRFSRLPVIIISGSGRPEDEQRAKEHGYEFFSKPFMNSVLIDRVGRLASARMHPAGSRDESGIARVTTLNEIRVVMLVASHRIEGTLHLAPEIDRFSDAWESLLRDRREFIPLTDATVRPLDGSPAARVPFIEIRKADISVAFPVDDATGPPTV